MKATNHYFYGYNDWTLKIFTYEELKEEVLMIEKYQVELDLIREEDKLSIPTGNNYDIQLRLFILDYLRENFESYGEMYKKNIYIPKDLLLFNLEQRITEVDYDSDP